MPRYVPGQSGNPGGRPRELDAARREARSLASVAVFGLVRILTDPAATPEQTLRAASILLRLGLGTGWQRSGQQERAWDRRRDLRVRVVALLQELAHRQPDLVLRGPLLRLLDELEREDGVPASHGRADQLE